MDQILINRLIAWSQCKHLPLARRLLYRAFIALIFHVDSLLKAEPNETLDAVTSSYAVQQIFCLLSSTYPTTGRPLNRETLHRFRFFFLSILPYIKRSNRFARCRTTDDNRVNWSIDWSWCHKAFNITLV